MQQIIITLVSAEGVVTKKTMLKLPGQPVQVTVPAGTKVAVDVQGPVAGKNQSVQQGAKPDLKFNQVGHDLIIEGDGEKLVELTNFYATPSTTLGVVGWDYAEPVIDAAATSSVEGKAVADQVAVSVSGAGSSAEALGFLSTVGWGGVALGGVAVAAIASGGGGGGAATTAVANNVVSGVITAGPLVSNHALSVVLYKADGSLINDTLAASTATVLPNGTFELNVGTYIGVVKAVVQDGDDAIADFSDEASGLNQDLSATLMAVGVITGSTFTLNINPLTSIAAQMAGVADDGTGNPVSQTAVTTANADVAKAFGLSDITTTKPDTTNDGTTSFNAIGAVLAALSGMDGVAGSMQTTINNLVAGISNGVLSDAQKSAFIVGAAAADTTGALGLVGAVSDLLVASVTTVGFSVNNVTADNVITTADALTVGDTLTGSCAAGTQISDLGIKFGSTAGTGSWALDTAGTAWTYTLSAADVTALTGTEGAATVTLEVAAAAKSARLVYVNMVDDAPTAVNLLNATTSFAENSNTAGLKVADISVVDPDGGTNTLTVTGTDASFFEVKTVNGKSELWLKAATSLDFETKDSYSVSVTANGTASSLLTVNVSNINEAPTGTSSTITIAEDVAGGRVLTAADFGFADTADSPANALAAVIITTLPTAGALKLNGVAVTLNQSIAVADLPNLVYAPALNANGNAYATIGFKVQDNGGTANGGADTSAAANTLTINVTAVNDAPTLATPTAITLTDTAVKNTFNHQAGTLVGDDVDTGTTFVYGITGGTTGGSTVIGGVTYDVSKVGTYGTLYVKSSDGSYVYVPNDAAINALTANQSETIAVTVADNATPALTGSANLVVNVTGADDAPVLATGFVTDGTPGTGDDDYVQLIVGQALSTGAGFAADFVDPDTGDAALVFSVISGAVPGLTFNADGTVTGTPTDAGITYPHDYIVKIRATDASNPALYVEHDYVFHMLKAPVIQSFVVTDTTTANTAALGKSGETLDVAVLFSEIVNVTGSPTITLNINGQSVTATYASGTGASDKTLHFSATVPAGSSADGSNITITAVTANGGGNAVIGADSSQPWDQTPMPSAYSGYRVDNTAPVLTTNYNRAENTATDTTLHTVQLVAADASAVAWSTTLGGADAAKFTLNASGLLSFVGTTNFEAKDDTSADGVYDITVTATDAAGNAVTSHAITVNLTNVNEAPTLVTGYNGGGTSGKDDYLTVARNVNAIRNDLQNDFSDPDGVGALGTPTLTYSLASGAMPTGLTLNADGSISGSTTATAGDYAIRVRVTDGGVTGDTTPKTVDHDYVLHLVDAPAISTTLGGETQLDVRSKIVLSVDQDVSLTSTGTFTITIDNTANTTTGTGSAVKNGYRTETTDRDQTITITNGVVSGDGTVTIDNVNHKIIIDTSYDFDLSNNYSLSVTAGAFTNTGTGLASNALSGITFSTVTPGLLNVGASAAVQAKSMNVTTGIAENSLRWLDITNPSDDDIAYAIYSVFDAATDGTNATDFAFVLKDMDPTSGNFTLTDTAIHFDNWGSGDLLYIDNQDRQSQATEQAALADAIFSGGDGTANGAGPFNVTLSGTLLASAFEIVVDSSVVLPSSMPDSLLNTITANGWSTTGMVLTG